LTSGRGRSGRVEERANAALDTVGVGLSVRRTAGTLVTFGSAIMRIVGHRLVGSGHSDAGSLAVDITWVTLPQTYLLRSFGHGWSWGRSSPLRSSLNGGGQKTGDENGTGDLHFAGWWFVVLLFKLARSKSHRKIDGED